MMHLVLDPIERHSREQNHRQRSAMLLQVSKHFKAIGAGHVQIEQHEIDRMMFEMSDGRITIGRFFDRKAGIAQQ